MIYGKILKKVIAEVNTNFGFKLQHVVSSSRSVISKKLFYVNNKYNYVT